MDGQERPPPRQPHRPIRRVQRPRPRHRHGDAGRGRSRSSCSHWSPAPRRPWPSTGLKTPEEDVVELEERVRELADEKARAQDEATTVQVERDVFVDLSIRVSSAVESLDACVTRLFDLLGDSIDAYNAAAAAASAAATADQLLRQ